jgi:hypothetical protein
VLVKRGVRLSVRIITALLASVSQITQISGRLFLSSTYEAKPGTGSFRVEDLLSQPNTLHGLQLGCGMIVSRAHLCCGCLHEGCGRKRGSPAAEKPRLRLACRESALCSDNSPSLQGGCEHRSAYMQGPAPWEVVPGVWHCLGLICFCFLIWDDG